MGLLGLLLVDPQVVFAGSVQPFMAEDLFDVDDGAAIENEISGDRVPENMRSKFLVDLRQFSVAIEEPPNIVSMEPGSGPLGDKHCFVGILARLQIPPEPVKGPFCKEDSSFLVSLSDDLRFLSFPVDAFPVERQRLADSHASPQ